MALNENFLNSIRKNVPKDTTFFGIFLIGSQNYCLNNSKSDEDYIAFVIPKLFPNFLNYSNKIKEKKILLETKIISSPLTIYPPSSVTIKYKDIRDLWNGLLKGNLNSIEILFSKKYYIEPKYSFVETFLKENKENLCLLNPLNLLRSIQGMVNSNFKNKTYNSNHNYRVYHAYRLINLVGAISLNGFKDNPFTSFNFIPKDTLLYLKEKGYSTSIEKYKEELLENFSRCIYELRYKYSDPSFKASQEDFIEEFNDFLFNQVCPEMFLKDLKGVFES